MRSSSEIREQFIDFFVERCGHTFVPSSPVVPHSDPTLLFANAGMNQFKDVFLGVGGREYQRAVNTQKCIRAGGKHNDLEDVGKDTYHHTFFEMLGNWSFGDYFKAEAIEWAWQLLTEVWGMDKNRLHATVFAGDEKLGLEPDEETAELWRTVTDIDPDHIHFSGVKDNFWEMGETGPCGPCSEIHIDRTPDGSGRQLAGAGDPRVIELWNLVFIQFERDSSGKLEPLPAKHVDTGLGFERLCAVLQNKMSNYETDVFTPIFAAIREVTGAAEYTGSLTKPSDIAYRVIADHIRTLTVALADGATPGSEGREYVLRRILRRAVRHGRQTLSVHEPFFHRLVPAVVERMGDIFGELRENSNTIAEIIRQEEEQFILTIDRGLFRFEQILERSSVAISGSDAFELESTYGFPIDLTQVMAEERHLTVDMKGYEEYRQQHQIVSRGEKSRFDVRESLLEIVRKGSLPATKFLSDDLTCVEGSELLSLRKLGKEGNFEPTKKLEAGQSGALVVDRTPFYAEAGGQVGDTGVFRTTSGACFRVRDTLKVGDVHFHLGELETGTISTSPDGKGEKLFPEVDEQRRHKTMVHHTTTHILNHSLRVVLGDHVQQKGSLVDDEKTRFDFSHTGAMTPAEIEKVERLVNEDLCRDLPVYAAEAPQQDALEINGLRAVFGEKYPPKVRVVTIGVPLDRLLTDPKNGDWQDYSIEFCGGTHLTSTGQAEKFVIVAEEAIAKGVRRLTAVGGSVAKPVLADAEAMFQRLSSLNEEDPALEESIAKLTDEIGVKPLPLSVKAKIRIELDELRKAIKHRQKAERKAAAGDVVEIARNIAGENDGPVIVASIEGVDQTSLRTAMDVIKQKRPDSALLLGSAADKKVSFIAAVPKPLIEKGLGAGDWVRHVAQITGGGGGGRPDMAQAGGKDPSKLDEALQGARTFAAGKIGTSNGTES